MGLETIEKRPEQMRQWQKRIVDEAIGLYQAQLEEIESQEKREAVLDQFAQIAQKVVAKQKEQWTQKLADCEDSDKKEAELALGLLIKVKEELSQSKKAV